MGCTTVYCPCWTVLNLLSVLACPQAGCMRSKSDPCGEWRPYVGHVRGPARSYKSSERDPRFHTLLPAGIHRASAWENYWLLDWRSSLRCSSINHSHRVSFFNVFSRGAFLVKCSRRQIENGLQCVSWAWNRTFGQTYSPRNSFGHIVHRFRHLGRS